MQRIQRGFTLIELLTVIAIIALLAGMTAAILPRVLEKAKLSSLDNDILQIRTGLVSYFADHKDSFPPAYGYIKWEAKDKPVPAVSDYLMEPYMSAIGMYNEPKLLDRFSDSFDGNRDGKIDLLEFMPIGIKNPIKDTVQFKPDNGIYGIHNVDYAEVLGAISKGGAKRPFYYVPVNLAQFKKAREYFVTTGKDDSQGVADAGAWNFADQRISALRFPPAKYDAFVLVSVGPSANTFGVVAPDDSVKFLNMPSGLTQRDYHHILCLCSYFRATRDLDNNLQGDGLLDYDFRARTTGGQAKNPDNKLPDFKWEGNGKVYRFENGAGPLIMKFP